MTQANLYRPPPPPPAPPAKRPDPLVALSKPPPPAPRIEPEELTDLTDEDMEQWAASGTRIMTNPRAPRSAAPAAPSLAATMPSYGLEVPVAPRVPTFPPYAPSYPPAAPAPSPVAKSHTMAWVLAAAVAALMGLGAIGVGAAWVVYHAHDVAQVSPTP